MIYRGYLKATVKVPFEKEFRNDAEFDDWKDSVSPDDYDWPSPEEIDEVEVT